MANVWAKYEQYRFFDLSRCFVHIYRQWLLTRAGNEEIAAKYRAVMTYPEEGAKESLCTWYLPRHPVTNPNKRGKLCIVFDAAAEFAGTFQNRNLPQGLDMTNSLVGVLLHFRQGRVGLAADVEAMFHQVQVQKEDQDAQHFLW